MIPSNFQTILDTVRQFLPRVSRADYHAVCMTDALMQALPSPEGHVLCACNRAWIPIERAEDGAVDEGHVFDGVCE